MAVAQTQQRHIPIKGAIPTTIPLSSPAARTVLESCDACFTLCESTAFDFEHGLCNHCAQLLGLGESGEPSI